jgi:hypothetical protein
VLKAKRYHPLRVQFFFFFSGFGTEVTLFAFFPFISSLRLDALSTHAGDEWWDLCAGPHVESTGQLNKKAIELESVAGALLER